MWVGGCVCVCVRGPDDGMHVPLFVREERTLLDYHCERWPCGAEENHRRPDFLLSGARPNIEMRSDASRRS